MRYSLFTILLLAACAAPTSDGDERTERGMAGKEDAVGECTAATCGTQGIGECYCDAECATYGDCCANREAICLAPTDPIIEGAVPEFGADTTREIQILATANNGLNQPRDLEFNNAHPDQLFIVNQGDNSVSVIHDFGSGSASIAKYSGPGGNHFCSKPAALAFGTPGLFATAQEQDQVTQPSTPWDFMGPTLWDSALPNFDAGHRSHIDMLHNSPNAVGIAHQSGNRYFVFDGEHQSISWYDFGSDHGHGGNDHSDGVVRRYAEGQVSYVPGTPSHLEFVDGLLYIADTGNQRIAVLDPSIGSLGSGITPNYDQTDQRQIEGASLQTFVGGLGANLQAPSGLLFHQNRLFVSDAATGEIIAFNMDGTELGRIDTGSAGIMGLTVGPEGDLYFINGRDETRGHVVP